MYEVLEHWKQYKLEQEKLKNRQEFDKWMNKLSTKNGVTKL